MKRFYIRGDTKLSREARGYLGGSCVVGIYSSAKNWMVIHLTPKNSVSWSSHLTISNLEKQYSFGIHVLVSFPKPKCLET